MVLLKGKFLVFGFIVLLLVLIPLTIYILQQRQATTTVAITDTKLFFTPSTVSIKEDQTFSLDIMIDPGTNRPIIAVINIVYDPSKLATASAGLVPNTTLFPQVLEGPTYSNGTAQMRLSVIDTTAGISSISKIGTISFRALAATSISSPTQIAFSNQSVVNSSTDPETNVLLLSASSPTTVTIQSSAQLSPVPSPTPTTTGSINSPTSVPTQTPTRTPTPTGGIGGGNPTSIPTNKPTPTPTKIIAVVLTTTPTQVVAFPTARPTTPQTNVPTIAPPGQDSTMLFGMGAIGVFFVLMGIVLFFSVQ